MDLYYSLPNEIIVSILKKLQINAILKCQFVCWKWHDIINDEINKSLLIDIQLKGRYKNKYIKFDKTMYSNYDIFKKVKLIIFSINVLIPRDCENTKLNLVFDYRITSNSENTNYPFYKRNEIKSICRILRIYDLRLVIGELLMLAPHKLTFIKIIDNNHLKKITKINDQFILLPNTGETRLASLSSLCSLKLLLFMII